MQRIGIIGVGLMGGSLGMALMRQKKWRVVGIGRREARLRLAKARRCIHEFSTDFVRGVRGCSVVVLATPVDEIVPRVKALRPALSPDTLVMDIGSVKTPIVRGLENPFSKGPFFVGTHPMAGSEKTGVEYARPDLYRGATCVVTPTPKTPAAAVRRAESFWRSVGARVLRLSPEEHDQWVALISHLPHLIADSMILAAARRPRAQHFVSRLAAGSFRDMTRVAGASPDQWSSIFRMNASHLEDAATLFQKVLRHLLKRRCPPNDLANASRWRAKFLTDKAGLSN